MLPVQGLMSPVITSFEALVEKMVIRVRTKKSQLQELNCPHNRNTSVPTSLNKSASSGGLALQTSANRASWAMASTLPWFLGR